VRPSFIPTLLIGCFCLAVTASSDASLKPQGPTSIITQVYRNPLDLPVLGTRAYLPIAWVAHVRSNPRGIAAGRETAASDTFDVVSDVDTAGATLSQGVLAPGAYDAFRMETRGYFFTDELRLELDTATGATGRVVLGIDDPNVLSNLLAQSFVDGSKKTPPTYRATLYPVRQLGGPSAPGPYELTLEDVQVYFGLPLARFTLDNFLNDLPAPDFAQALVTLPAHQQSSLEVASDARYNRNQYSLATIGRVRARNVETLDEWDFGSVAFAQTPRGLPEPTTLALLAGGCAALAAQRRRQRTKWRACPIDSGVTSTTPSGLT
jgi:hypothetical protein